MSIHSTNAKAGPFIADGSQREFPYRFKVLDPSHIQVYINGAAVDGGYTVNESSVMMDVAPPAGANVVLLREVPLTQEVDIQNNTAFYPEVLEGAYDKLTMITQQLAEQVERSIKVGVGETDASPDALLQGIYAAGSEATAAAEEAKAAAEAAQDALEDINGRPEAAGGLPVGSVFASPSAMPQEGAYLLNGQTIACGEELYRKFYEWVTTSPVRRITADEYEAEIAEYGICNGFVVSGASVRLPLWKGYQTPLGDSVPVRGNGMTLGLTEGVKFAGLEQSGSGSATYLFGNTSHYGDPVGTVDPADAFGSLDWTKSVGITADPDKSGIIADTSGYPQDGFHWCIQVFNAATALSEQESAHLASEMQMKAQTDLGNVTNPTQGFKDMAIGWGVPDYSAGVEIPLPTGTTSYTAPTGGCLYVSAIIGTSGQVKVFVKGVQVISPLVVATNSTGIRDTVPYCVAKGDVVTLECSTAANNAIFYPLKGAN